MFIQIEDDIVEILNDDVLFIVLLENEERGDNDLSSIYLMTRNGEKIFGKMSTHSLYIHSKFLINKEKWEYIKCNINL